MKNLLELATECMSELDALGIEYGTIRAFRVNNRAKRRWGQCRRHNLEGDFTIEISGELLKDYIADKSTKQTIIHELLHTVDGCFCHTGKWKKLADLVNDCYMYNVSRTTSAKELGVIEEEDYNYIIACKHCGAHYHYYKETNFVKSVKNDTRRYRCGKCKSDEFEMLKYKGCKMQTLTCKVG